jgi:hypothetical protein
MSVQTKRAYTNANLASGFEHIYQPDPPKKENYRKVGIHEWWTDYCSSHGTTAHSTAWGGICIMCAKHVK